MAKPRMFTYSNMILAFKELGLLFTDGAFAEYRRRYDLSTKYPATLGADKRGQERYFDLKTSIAIMMFIIKKKRMVIEKARVKEALLISLNN